MGYFCFIQTNVIMRSHRFSLLFSSILMQKTRVSVLHLKWILMYGVWQRSYFILSHVHGQFSWPSSLSRTCCIHCPVPHAKGPYMGGVVFGLSTLLHGSVVLFGHKCHIVLMNILLYNVSIYTKQLLPFCIGNSWPLLSQMNLTISLLN